MDLKHNENKEVDKKEVVKKHNNREKDLKKSEVDWELIR